MGISGGPYIVRDSSLVLELDAADKNSYAGSGTVWSDLTGNSNNGTLTNGPTFNSGNGGSIFTDGTNDLISTPYSGSAADSYTFSAWFNNDNYSETKYVLGRGRDGAGNGWSLQLNVTTAGIAQMGVVYTVPSTVGTGANGTSILALNTWYYITGVWSAGSVGRIYVNGILEGSLAITGTSLRTSTNGWWIGSVDTTLFSSGYNAVAQVYNRVLSVDEINQNYNAQKSRFGL
jgi:hypothetical protein